MKKLKDRDLLDAVAFAKAIADETRQRIMKLCCCRRLTVSEITEQIGVSQPTVSHHLAILRDAGLVTADREGRETYYSLNQERITACCGRLMLTFAPEERITHQVDRALKRAQARPAEMANG
ncbi:MAG: metalloregulator ArsR/SmtB family transcription factor [Anaerolineae bacterium]|nr:metalloregulator ArsR/SmtB family transcription factor [Candidatus Roseilinea sp.]MDW8449002.1 metalloregulator ArsR/SmtB family transcription factor [Anaerolineae bacterium]